MADFPTHVIHPDRELYRIHRRQHGPLHFATIDVQGDGGRFDLPATSGQGTCYLATSPTGAFLETLGRFRVITGETIADRLLTTLVPTVPLTLADLTDRRVLGRYGIAGDVSTGTDYLVSQQWAEELWRRGFDGVHYAARHDPQFTERSVAVFGRVGAPDGNDDKGFTWSSVPIPDSLIDEVTSIFGVVVTPPTPDPASADHEEDERP